MRSTNIYEHIDEKISELFNLRLARSFFIHYLDMETYCLMKVQWCSHSIFKLVIYYPRPSHSTAQSDTFYDPSTLQQRIRDLFKSDNVLKQFVFECQPELMNLIKCTQGSLALMENKEFKHIEKKWIWEKKYIKSLDEVIKWH
jgi:hypothetical protein